MISSMVDYGTFAGGLAVGYVGDKFKLRSFTFLGF